MNRCSQIITRLAVVTVLTTIAAGTCMADRVNWSSDIEQSLRSANESGKLVLLKFTADWCGYCKKMERETFTRPKLAAVVNEQFVPVLVDADKHQALVRHLKIEGLPALLIVSPEMVILDRISGYQTEAKLLPRLNTVIAKHQRAATPQATVAASPGFTPAPTRPVSKQTVSAPTPTARERQTLFAENEGPQRPAVLDEPSFGGLCLPGVSESRSLVSGMPQLATKYRGRTLYFSSPEKLQKFKTNPSKYWPMQDGTCPVTLLESGRVVEGRLEYAAMFRKKLWVMSSAEQMQKFVAQPARYADALKAKQPGK